MSFSTLTLTTLLAIFSSSILTTSAQSTNNVPACVSNLIPCANYLATTATPPQSCCGPLKTAVTTQIDCLCGLYNTPGLLKSFNINITQALDLPKRCRIDGATLAACSEVAGSAPPPSESVAPSGNPGKDENAAGRSGFHTSALVIIISWVGMLQW